MQDSFLLNVEKPARYMGHEMGSVIKDESELCFALAFPDVYEVGMSHLGLKILYSILNNEQWIAAERVYAPWPDMEDLLRKQGLPLSTLESGKPLASVDILGFTLQYELSYTNILNMLELAGIPLLAADRGDGFPLVIGGGPCAANPEPLADFFDAFVLGDGEEVVLELAAAVRDGARKGLSRNKLLRRLADIEGVYVPSFFTIEYTHEGNIAAINPHFEECKKVRRRFLADLESAPYPASPVVPFMKTVHDRVSIEIARGCTRGCRFCQAGYIYRPVRERSPAKLLAAVEESLRNSGYDEISLLSLSTGDYCQIGPLLKALMKRYADERIAVSLPSLRVGTLTSELVEEIKKVRKTGFTLAPEAGSDRLRNAINKGISEEDLLENAYSAFAAGWRLIKLYFMIGLPGETEEDLLAIVELSRKVKFQAKKAGRGGEVNVAVSNFVPKAHTPFQWEPQDGESEIHAKQRLLRQELRKAKLNFKWHDISLSSLEGVFARGDRRLGKVLLRARELGCRFDGWGEHFDALRWKRVFEDVGIEPGWYLRRRALDEILPWDHLDFGVTGEFLKGELKRSVEGRYTEDCRYGNCSACGVCDFDRVKVRLENTRIAEGSAPFRNEMSLGQLSIGKKRVRVCFEKIGLMRLLSHLEMINLFTRAIGRAGVPIRYSQGFHPHPKFSFATALSVGIESFCEYMDMEVEPGADPNDIKNALNGVLPNGVRILSAEEIPLNSQSLSVIIEAVQYRIILPELTDTDITQKVRDFLELESFPWRREKRGKVTEYDLRHELVSMSTENGRLNLAIRRGKPLEYASAVTGHSAESLAGCRIEKVGVVFSGENIGIDSAAS